jgi:Zn-dependent protease
MGLVALLSESPLTFFILVPILLYSVILHEVAHGWAAYLFGDNTAKAAGRLSLSPGSHIDPLGALCVLFVGFGWARPVPVNYFNLRHSKLAIIAVALAGCLVNIIIAALALFLLHFEIVQSNNIWVMILDLTERVNIILAALNLIPIPPLDGSRVLTSFLSPDLRLKFAKIEPYGFFLVIALIFTGLLDPVIHLIESVILVGIGLLFSF